MGRLQRVQITQESSPPRLMSYVGPPHGITPYFRGISATENLVAIQMANTDNLHYEMGLMSSWHPGRVRKESMCPSQFHCSISQTFFLV